MFSGIQKEELQLSAADFDWLEQNISGPSAPEKRKQEFQQLAESIEKQEQSSEEPSASPPTPKKHKREEAPSTPEGMKCYVSNKTVITPNGARYARDEKVGEGNYGKVYRCRAESGREIALKKRLEFIESPHVEAKKAAKLAQRVYGYGSFFCPKEASDADCKALPHYLATPYFPGKDPEEILEDYFDVVVVEENAASLVMFGLLTVFIAVAKSYKDFSEKHGLVHGDVQATNMKLALSSNAKEIQAIMIDFDHTREMGELTCGEGGLHQGSELNAKIPASPLQDVYSIGCFYDEMMKSLIQKGIYTSREKNDDRGLLNPFFEELDLLEMLIEEMMFDKGAESFKKRPSPATVLAKLAVIFESAQHKFNQIKDDDFSVAKILLNKTVGPDILVAASSSPKAKVI